MEFVTLSTLPGIIGRYLMMLKVTDILDIAIMVFVFYKALTLIQSTRAASLLKGVLVFLAALARALHIPQPNNGKTLCAAGLAAFALGLCWQLPQCFALLAGNGMDLAVMPDFFAGLGLCCVGSIGGVCAAACLNRQS